jgi:tRNA(Ile)-lysidine synthase
MSFSKEAFEAAVAEAIADGASHNFAVALSGGLDSTVALHALRELSLTGSLRAIHVDHGLHPDSGAWRDHCERVCLAIEVPFTDAVVDARPGRGESPEEAARRARYGWLTTELQPGEILVTGHHADDQLETVLLQLLRGAGPAGLAAMPALARLGAGWLCRPLLRFRRQDLQTWARARGLSWLEDPSNREAGFDRNYLRHEVLPALYERWPAAAVSAVRSARHCGEAAELLAELADGDLSVVSGDGTLDVSRMREFSSPRQRNLLRRWLTVRGLELPDARRTQSILDNVLGARRDRRAEVRWPGGSVRRYRDRLFALDRNLLARLDRPRPDGAWSVDQPLELGGGMGRLRLVCGGGPGLSRDGLEKGPLHVRYRVGGEKIRLPGRAGTRSVKKLLQEAGVPPWWRRHIPLIWCGDRLLCVADLWYSADSWVAGPEGCLVVWEDRPDFS